MKKNILIFSFIFCVQFSSIAQLRKSARRNIASAKVACNICPNPLITQDETIYGDALNVNWQIFPTTISLNTSNSSPQFINSRSIKVTNPTVNQLLDLRYNNTSLNTVDYPDGFEFWVYNESTNSYPLTIQAFTTSTGVSSPNFSVIADANKWTHFLIDWSFLGNQQTVGRLTIKLDQTQTGNLYFDEIKLVHCADMYSTKTGNWNDQTLWSCGRLPILTDVITIDPQHTVTVLNGVSATLNILQLLGTLDIKPGAFFNMKKF